MKVPTNPLRSVIAIDPGLAKCGLVYLAANGERHVERSIVPTERLVTSLQSLLCQHEPVEAIVIGSGTGSGTLARAIRQALPQENLLVVDEKGTTLLARERYFQEHPPRGWRKLIPITLQVPNEPIDDYAALLLAERFLVSQVDSSGAGPI